MPEKYAKIINEIAFHFSDRFPGAWWITKSFRIVDMDGHDLLDMAEWSRFKKVTKQRALELGYTLVGEEETGTDKVVYRRAASFEEAFRIKKRSWKEGNECFVHKHEDGSFSTWEVWS